MAMLPLNHHINFCSNGKY